MAQFGLTASENKRVISDLTADNSEFKNRVNELQELQQELAAQWEGDSKNAFQQAFDNDKSQWTTFANLIDQYIQALQTITQEYEKAEAANVEIASTRSY